jgi:probable HAF family extracellular repeat protein
MRRVRATGGFLCLLLAGAAFGQQPVFQGLGFGPATGPGRTSRAVAISPDGNRIIGSTNLDNPNWPVNWSWVGFEWTPAGGMIVSPAIELLINAGVTNSGDLAGRCIDFRATVETGFRRLGGVWADTGAWRSHAISPDSHWIVGFGYDGGAFRWSAASGYQLIGGMDSVASDITADGALVVGSYGGQHSQGFVWTEAGGFQSVGGLPGVPVPDSALVAVAGMGSMAVGSALNGSGNLQPVRWYPGRGLRLINNLAGFPAGRALDVSADGEVIVGTATDQFTAQRAFLWDRVRGTRDLRSYLIQLGSTQVQGWTLQEAGAISADGRVIAGYGIDSDGFTQAFVARIPAFCYANCDISVTAPVLNVLDFNCFLNRFALGSEYANCDGSTVAPVLNVLDFNCFLNRFSAGCP